MAPKAKNLLQNENKTMNDFPNLKNMLPANYDYYFESYEQHEQVEGEQHFTASFRISQDVATKENVRRWIDEYCSHSLTTFRIDRTYPNETTWFMYRVDLRCHHNTKPTSHKRVQTPHKKHTACPAKMIVKIRQDRLSQRKRREIHLKTHPVEVILDHQHNHPTLKKYRDPDAGLVEKFRKMFRAGYKPAAALEIHKRDLRMEHGDNYVSVLEDRGLCPDVNWCYRQFNLVCREGIDTNAPNLKMLTLDQYLCEYNKKYGEKCAALKLLNDTNSNVVVALLSPLMKSSHNHLECSGQLTIIHSQDVDYLRCKVYLLMTHSRAGGLPLGVLVTTSDSSCVLQEAMSMYVELLSERGFAGRGLVGPSVIMVEDDGVQNDVMRATFPEASLFLSPYHIICRMWEYLWDTQSNIRYSCQMQLFEIFKDILHSKSEVDFENNFSKLMLALEAQPSSKFVDYIHALYVRKYEWAVCLRENFESIVGNSNIVQFCLSSLHENILKRNKSCTMIELIEFLTNDMEEFFKEKLSKYVDDRNSDSTALRYSIDKKAPESLEIVPHFKVRNVLNGAYYDVDLSSGLCSCSAGMSSSPCQHQHALVQMLNVSSLHKSQVRSEQAELELMKVIGSLGNLCKSNRDLIKDIDTTDASASSVSGKPDLEMFNVGFPNENDDTEQDGSAVGYAANAERDNVANPTTNEYLDISGVFSSSGGVQPNGQTESAQPNKQAVDFDFSRQTEVLEWEENDSHYVIMEDSETVTKSTASRYFPCSICSKILTSWSRLAKHQRLHNHNKRFICDICSLGYNSRKGLKNHCARNHSGKKTFDCDICGKKFKRLGSIVRHRKEHNAKNLKCSYCNKSFSVNGDLTNHMDSVHGGMPTNIILEVKNHVSCPLQLPREDIKEIIIIDTEGQLPISGVNPW